MCQIPWSNHCTFRMCFKISPRTPKILCQLKIKTKIIKLINKCVFYSLIDILKYIFLLQKQNTGPPSITYYNLCGDNISQETVVH